MRWVALFLALTIIVLVILGLFVFSLVDTLTIGVYAFIAWCLILGLLSFLRERPDPRDQRPT
jgi:hypothetical protein